MRVQKFLTAVAAVLLIGVPVLAAVPVGAASAQVAATETRIDLTVYPLRTDYLDSVTVSGNVMYNDPAVGWTYLEGVTVELQRRYLGTDQWVTLASAVAGAYIGDFDFTSVARQNAEYRVAFAGDDTYLPSSASQTVRVHRLVSSRGSEPRHNVFYLSGKVRPSYAGHRLYLTRQRCSTCAWRTIASQKATSTSTYRFRLPLPPRGATHYFRVRVPASTQFLVSYSSAWRLWVI